MYYKRRQSKEPVRGAEMDAMTRLEVLFDSGTFVELQKDVSHRSTLLGMDKKKAPGDGVIVGFGKINGRTVYAYSQDRSILGGSLGEAHARKITSVMDLAGKSGCPIIGINDSGGARIQEGIDALGGYGEIFKRNVKYSGVIPQISIILGPCAGGAVYSPALTDCIIMCDKKSYMFVTGPKVIKKVLNEEVTPEELGGGETHSRKSGVSHLLAHCEVDALQMARDFLSFLPENNMSDPSKLPYDSSKASVNIEQIVPTDPRKPYEARDLIADIVDDGEFFEVKEKFSQNIRVGFSRICGRSIGIIANNPKMSAGCLDIDASRKAARFIRMCNSFNIPILTLIDVPGFLPGKNQEHLGIIDHGAKLLYAYCEATVPKISLIVRKAFGGAYIAMASKHIGADYNFAYPTAQIAVMGAEGAVEILNGKEIKASMNPEIKQKEYLDDYTEKFLSPEIAEARGYIDAVIDPCETRNVIAQCLDSIENKRESLPPKKNGNCPM